MGEVKACGLCGGTDLAPILDMGAQPLAERYGTDERYPLALAECADCTLVQLTYAVDPVELFPPDHPYMSGTTAALREHFAALANRLATGLRGGDLVVDIGANDGTLLSCLDEEIRRVAVEPTGQAARCAARGLDVYREFFTRATAGRILAEHGPARTVTATNVLAHVPDPHDFAEGVAMLLAPDGVFVAENHDVANVLSGEQIDTVYHEHARYWSLATVSRLLAAHGLQVDEAQRIPTHGGSFRVWARKRPGGLQDRADAAARALHKALAGIVHNGHKVYGVGATTRAAPLIHYAGIAPFITCVVEQMGSAKIGQVMPGTAIPIVDEGALYRDRPGYALLLAWHLSGAIIDRLRRGGYTGRFIVPLPGPRVTDG